MKREMRPDTRARIERLLQEMSEASEASLLTEARGRARDGRWARLSLDTRRWILQNALRAEDFLEVEKFATGSYSAIPVEYRAVIRNKVERLRRKVDKVYQAINGMDAGAFA
ncbi:MAG: hypothetical protein LBU11_04945 [Zoogloeaceae bacterium]|jgi:hypothetical protein|nr:hypothetical protein [Zoogloeaceae bacterium]